MKNPHITPPFQPELFPVNDYTQRWKEHRPSWRHPDEGGFDSKRYDIASINDDATAKSFVIAHHYSASCPAMVHRIGMYEDGQLVGIAILSVPVQKKVLTKPFPSLIPYTESLELGRFLLLDQVPSNGETYFLARVFEQLRKEGVAGLVSFSDPVARTNSFGDIIFPGHIGHIYRTKGAIYTGRTKGRTLFLLPDGTIFHERTLQKIRSQEEGHEGAEKRLRELGAPPRYRKEPPAEWLLRAIASIGVRQIRHSGNHRYCFPLNRRVQVQIPTFPYPRRSSRTPCMNV